MIAVQRRLLLGTGLALPFMRQARAQQDISRAANFIQATGQELGISEATFHS